MRVTLASGETRTDTSFIQVAGRSLRYEMEQYNGDKVWIMAHRGRYDDMAGRGFRRTPWRPFSVAWSLGCVDIIETDVRTTKDGRLVVCHDNTTINAANGGGFIRT